MGKLQGRGLPPRISSGGFRRIAGAPPTTDEMRAASDHRKLYKDPRWAPLRLAVLRRDQWTCRQTGVLLIGKAPAPDSPVVDHIRPHRGDAELFFDPDNLQAVSKAWHDSVKQSLDRLRP